MTPESASTVRFPAALDRAARLALVLLVISVEGVSAFMIDRPWWDPWRLAFLLLGGLFLILFLTWGERLSPRTAPLARAAYFAVQLALASVLLVLLAAVESYGIGWILFMPLVAQGVMVLTTPGAATVALAVPLLAAVHAGYLGGLRSAVEAGLGVATAVLFVILFTVFALREARAREESERLRSDLATARDRLAAFALGAEELATSRERNRLAREIHDSLGHYLTVVNVQLEAAEVVLERAPAEARQRIRQARELVREGLADVRRSVAALRAGPLEGRSLTEALAGLVEEAQTSGEAEVTFDAQGDPRPLSGDAALTLYRAAQEGLTNARKHARAHRIQVSLEYRSGAVRLAVEDDGVGATGAGEGYGLLGLAERARLLGGRCELHGRPRGGASLTVEIPA